MSFDRNIVGELKTAVCSGTGLRIAILLYGTDDERLEAGSRHR